MTYIKRLSALATLLAALVVSPWAGAQTAGGTPQKDLPSITLQAGMHNIRAELAQTPNQWQTGLMYRREMAQHEGMLFVTDQVAPRCFWMLNTPLPLSVAFLDDDGTIVNIEDMKPFSPDSHCSTRPVRFVLEMHQGWFAKRGIKAGFKLRGAPFTAPAAAPR